jgi:hypothetical protein
MLSLKMSQIKALVKQCTKISAPFSSFPKAPIKPRTFEQSFGPNTFSKSHVELQVLNFNNNTHKKKFMYVENTMSDKADG